MALPGEVDRWWRQRSEMRLVKQENGWRIEGNGKERARIAYATLCDDRLTYSVEDRHYSTRSRRGLPYMQLERSPDVAEADSFQVKLLSEIYRVFDE
jgi:hypothetical protein